MNILLRKRNIPQPNQNLKLNRIIIAAGVVSLAAYLAVQLSPTKDTVPYSKEMIKAAQIMEQAIIAIREYCDQVGISINETIDHHRTGLIGTELSPIATTPGNLEAKRTTTNPNFAAILVHLLDEAGVSTRDTIAIGCSASFPGLMIASLAATQAMEIHPIIIISLGASSFGATNPDFNLLNIYQVLLHKNILSTRPAAISLGGDMDIGRDFDPDTRERLIQQTKSSGIPFIYEADLQKNVASRMKIYRGDSSKTRLSAFINIGGSYVNIGTSEVVLKVKPGLTKSLSLPAKTERGVLFEMADRKVPIIHLLYIKGLAMKYGLPWDPTTLPNAGEIELLEKRSGLNHRFLVIGVLYFLMLLALFSYSIISNSSSTGR